jgi:calcineurin-like phosphoesterase family protein
VSDFEEKMSNQRKKLFFWSDLHIGHTNVIKFDERPFKDLDHMHRVLINNYNSTVPDDGICYFLGDAGMGKSDVLSKFMSELNGSTKILILGNHDNNMYSMYDKGFDCVLNACVFYIGDKRISMSHCPLPGIFREDITDMKGSQPGENWHGEFKNQRFTSQDPTVDYHLHGHIHSDGKIKPRQTLNQFDVGVRANGYRPVSISTIESWISIREKNEKIHLL